MNTKNKKDFEKVTMMGDPHHFILLKTDFSNKDSFKGSLVFKCLYRAVLEVSIDTKDKKMLIIELLKDDYSHFSEVRQSAIGGQGRNIMSSGAQDFTENHRDAQ